MEGFLEEEQYKCFTTASPPQGRGPVCFTVVSPAPRTDPDVSSRYLINVRDRKKGKGGKEDKKKDRKKEGKIMTKPKTEVTRSYLQLGEVGGSHAVQLCGLWTGYF